MDRLTALSAFRLLTEAEQLQARAASIDHAAECLKFKRKSRDAHKLLRDRFWEQYPDAHLPERSTRIWIEDTRRRIAGLIVALRILGRDPPRLVRSESGQEGLWRATPIGDDLAALAAFIAARKEDWGHVDQGTPQFAAWRDRLQNWTGFKVDGERLFTEPFDKAVHGLPPSHADFRLRKSAIVLRVPTIWPPRKDGTLYQGSEENEAGNDGAD